MNTPESDQAPCRHCGRAEGEHDFIPESGELRLLSIQPRQAGRRAAELVAARHEVSARDLLTASRSKLAPFPEARAELVCLLRRAAGMAMPEIAEALGWDRSALYARERKARLAREAWDAAREREAGERLFAAALSVDPESGVRVVGASEDEGAIRLQVRNTSDAPAVVAGSFAVREDVGEASEPETLREKLTRMGLGDGTGPSEPETPRERFIRREGGGVLAVGGPAEVEDGWRDEAGRLVVLLRDGTQTLRGRLVLPEAFDLAELVRQCAPEQAGAPEQHSPAVPVVQDPAEPAGRFSAGGVREAAARQDGAGPLWTDLVPVGGGGAEKGSAEAAADEGKQLADTEPPPPHQVAQKQPDAGVGVYRVGHEGLEPPSAQVAQDQPIGEGAENRGSTKAVAAGAENLNTGTEGRSSRTGEQEAGTGVQVTRDQDSLVQDCTRVGVFVGRLLREAEERGARQAKELLREALDAERAELARVRQAWAKLGLELAAERELARRLLGGGS